MRIYCVTEDSQQRFFLADTMGGAIRAAFEHYVLEDLDPGEGAPDEAKANELRREWEDSILEAVQVVGELENPLAGFRATLPPAMPQTLAERLAKIAHALYHGDSMETMRDPLAALYEAIDAAQKSAAAG